MVAEYDRRGFLKLGATLGAGLALGGANLSGCAGRPEVAVSPIEAAPIDTVRVGFVGVGGRGSELVKILLNLEAVEIRAVCDIVEDKVSRIQRWVQQAGQRQPVGYSRGETDFERMCQQEDLDLVITATPWRWHSPVCIAAMKAGKHAATEVPAAVTTDQCWQLVETSEKQRRYCVMLENCCYFRNVMMVLKMLRAGLFGELMHCEAGYQHDVRYTKFDSNGKLLWRGKQSVKRNGNLYPTHPIGPIAQWANINRGNRFDYLVSMSTQSRGLNVYAAEKFGKDHPLAKKKYNQGDVNTSLIHTVKGLTVTLYHDTQLPRPYDLIYRVQGTKGIYSGTLNQIYLEGTSPQPHTWESIDKYDEEYMHPLWKALEPVAKKYGHGGGDYMELYRLIKTLRTGTPPDMDVYDAATWSVISELSERSVANKSRPVDFPDFTRGRWKTNQPIGIVEA